MPGPGSGWVSGWAWLVAESRSLNGPREHTIIITSGHKQLPDLTDPDRVDVTGEVDERRMLTDERGEAA